MEQGSSKKSVVIQCAYCKGTGLDRFGVPSKLSTCQACNGRKEVCVSHIHETCLGCAGTGVYPHHRLTCSVCGGKGVVRKLQGKKRGEGCTTENAGPLDMETGLPCINAYELN
ncbi:MAG: hypothetical protein AAB893_04050 [Patescibacteria group bacterium]